MFINVHILGVHMQVKVFKYFQSWAAVMQVFLCQACNTAMNTPPSINEYTSEKSSVNKLILEWCFLLCTKILSSLY